MKNSKKLTRKHKELLDENGYDPKDWLLERQEEDGWIYIKKYTKEILKLSFE